MLRRGNAYPKRITGELPVRSAFHAGAWERGGKRGCRLVRLSYKPTRFPPSNTAAGPLNFGFPLAKSLMVQIFNGKY